jgi:hypothetical protein
MWPMRLIDAPLGDRGGPGSTNGNAVTNARIRVCSTVVLMALTLRNRFIPLFVHSYEGTAPPALNGVDNDQVFKSYSDIVNHRCDAWRKLVNQPWKIRSIGLRDRAHGF